MHGSRVPFTSNLARRHVEPVPHIDRCDLHDEGGERLLVVVTGDQITAIDSIADPTRIAAFEVEYL